MGCSPPAGHTQPRLTAVVSGVRVPKRRVGRRLLVVAAVVLRSTARSLARVTMVRVNMAFSLARGVHGVSICIRCEELVAIAVDHAAQDLERRVVYPAEALAPTGEISFQKQKMKQRRK